MKKFTFSLFTLVCIGFLYLAYSNSSSTNMFYPTSRTKSKLPLAQKIEGRAKEREMQLLNYDTKTVNSDDWYKALKEVLAFDTKLSTRGEDLKWESVGPEHVGGRTRAFVFDKLKEGKCYTGGVSGGIFVSEDLGFSWKPVKNMDINSPVLSIGCMTQSKDGDIYAGTGEYWGNTPGGNFGSQFYGGGIYKKKATEEEFIMLASTFVDADKNNPSSKIFKQVLDITTSPLDNEKVFAATDDGLRISNDGGTTFNRAGGLLANGVIAQIKAVDDGGLVLYAGKSGKVYKSTDGGTNWTDLIGSKSEWTADGKQHMRIAVSAKNPKKVYAVGITTAGDFKYCIKSEDGGTTWRLIGKADALTNPLCADISGSRACQGWYDLCLAVHPHDEDLIFLGGMQSLYSRSEKDGWVLISFWNNPATEGLNKVHSDMHEFAFHPTHPDTMVVCTDGGNYMTYDGYSKSTKSTWIPKNTGYNVTQFYDMNVNKYGEMIGGAQDNGTNLVALRGTNIGGSIEVSGGDGFDAAISAAQNYQVIFSTVYNGSLARAATLTSARSNIVSGSCTDVADNNGNMDNVDFHTRIHLAESVIPNLEDETKDSIEFSYLFGLNGNGFYLSNNAYITNKTTKWTASQNPTVGTPLAIHQSPNISVAYIAGTGGIKKITGLRTCELIDSFLTTIKSKVPCLYFKPGKGLTYTPTTGASGSICGIYVDQKDDNHVVATAMGFGGTAHVFETTNGTTFVSKQGNLPNMPVYTCVIDPENSKHVVIGTEFGIWETDDISVASPTWVNMNKLIGRVPVFKLRVNKLRKEGCYVLYAGTHGRGFWRAPFPYNANCDYTPKARTLTSSIEPFSNIKAKFEIYPNPTEKDVNITFYSDERKTVYIGIYDVKGQLVKREVFRALPGDNISTSDVSSLMKGSYVVRLEDEKSVLGGKILQKN